MSMVDRAQRVVDLRERGGVSIAAAAVPDTSGMTGVGFIDTMVDRANYGLLEAGTGKWAFGTLNTPQNSMMNWLHGWDPEVHTKPDPNWKGLRGDEEVFKRRYQAEYASVLVVGGDELWEDITKKSVSADHMRQRMDQALLLARSKLAMEDYDRQAGILNYGATKVSSALINYVASDPSTTVAIIATAGTAALPSAAARGGSLGLAEVVAARSLTFGQKAALVARHNQTALRASTYLYDTLDGASAGYSGWVAMNDQVDSLYGTTRQKDENWTDDVLFGATLGVSFSAFGDMYRAMFSKNARGGVAQNSSAFSAAENSAAIDGTLGTEADELSKNAWFSAKSRLEKALDVTEGAESEIRGRLMDDATRDRLGLGTAAEMDSFAKWVEESRPTRGEIAEELARRDQAYNRASSIEDGLQDYLDAGGDQRHFFRQKAANFLRETVGEEFGQYRFLIDWFEEATGDSRIVAEWFARGDKERVVRAVNAINANRKIGELEAQALESARVKIFEQNRQAVRQNMAARQTKFENAVKLGKWKSAVIELNAMQRELFDRAGTRLAELESVVGELNTAFRSLNLNARRRLGSFNKVQEMMVRMRELQARYGEEAGVARRTVERAMDESRSVSDMVSLAHMTDPLVNFAGKAKLDEIEALRGQILEEIKKLQRASELVDARYGKTRELQGEAGRISMAGKNALERAVSVIGDFPLVEARLSSEGYASVMRGVAAATRTSNRWRVDFVNVMLGRGVAENALEAGVTPMAPILRELPPGRLATAKDVDRELTAALAEIGPAVQRIREAAKDMDIPQQIEANLQAAAAMRAKAEQGRQLLGRFTTPAAIAKLNKIIKRSDNIARRLERLAKRQQAEFDNRMVDLNEDLPLTPRQQMEAAEHNRRNGAVARRDTLRNEKSALETADPEKYYGPKGRNLRNKLRDAEVEIEGGTGYQKTKRKADLVDRELETANARLEDLKKKGSTDADPDVINQKKDIEYLNKEREKITKEMRAIENRPVAMKRRHSLNGPEPKAEDVMELSRLRASARLLRERGEEGALQNLMHEIYAKFGNALEINRWSNLEDILYNALAKGVDTLDEFNADQVLSIKMEGSTAVVRVRRAAPMRPRVEDELTAEAVSAAEARMKARGIRETAPPDLSSKGRKAFADADRPVLEEGAAARAAEDAEDLAKRTEENVVIDEIRISSESRFSPTGPTKTVDNATGATVERPAADMEVDERRAKIANWLKSGDEGERLLIAQNAVRALGAIPGMRQLGQAVLRLSTQGAAFGRIHTVGRQLDMLVRVFNMMDAPEAVTKDIGSRGYTRTYQNARDQCNWYSNRVVSAAQQHRLGRDSWGRIDSAMISRNTGDLSPGELEVYNLMREGYEVVANARRRAGKSVVDNFYAREPNFGILRNNLRRAVEDFGAAVHDYIRGADQLPDSLADQLGVPRGTNYAALSPERRAAFDTQIREYARVRGNEIVKRLSGGAVIDDEGGYRIATVSTDPAGRRSLEDALVGDARLRQYYLPDPMMAFRQYMNTRAPGDLFDASISDMVGFPTSMREVIEVLGREIAEMPAEVQVPFRDAVKLLESKWGFSNGHAEYTYSSLFNPFLRKSAALVKASAGAMWGMAGLAVEVPRVLLVSKMYGGNMRAVSDLLYAARNAGNMEVLEDIVHGLDQFNDAAHSAFGSDVGLTAGQRLMAPWERFWGVLRGTEVVTDSGETINRASGTFIAGLEAVGSNAVRMGGMQYFSGVARIVADRQAKKFLARNTDRMRQLAVALEGIGPVSEQTPEALARFKAAAQAAGLDWDLAIRLNHNGLLNKNVIDNLERALGGSPDVFRMRDLRARLDDDTFTRVMAYLTEAHNFTVPVTSFATSVQSRNALVRAFYMLTSYSRSFALNVAFRSTATFKLGNTLSLFAAIAIGENLYQTFRSYAMGKSDDLMQEYEDDPSGTFARNAVKSPWLGAHTNMLMSGIGTLTGDDKLASTVGRGENIITPTMRAMGEVSDIVFGDKPVSETAGQLFEKFAPVRNAWYTRLMVNSALEN